MASTPSILVVGGAGYIGSHMVKYLLRQGCNVVTYDNLSTGHCNAIPCNHAILANAEVIPTSQQPEGKSNTQDAWRFESSR